MSFNPHVKRSSSPAKSITSPYGVCRTSNAKPDTRKGWTYKARQQYVTGRFDDLQATNTVPPINHKVEQVVRGLAYGLCIQNTSTNVGHMINDDPYSVVHIGKMVGGKLRPHAGAVTRLAMMGYSAQTLLENVSRCRMVGDDGYKHPVIAPDEDGNLYCALEFLRVEAWHLVFNTAICGTTGWYI